MSVSSLLILIGFAVTLCYVSAKILHNSRCPCEVCKEKRRVNMRAWRAKKRGLDAPTTQTEPGTVERLIQQELDSYSAAQRQCSKTA